MQVRVTAIAPDSNNNYALTNEDTSVIAPTNFAMRFQEDNASIGIAQVKGSSQPEQLTYLNFSAQPTIQDFKYLTEDFRLITKQSTIAAIQNKLADYKIKDRCGAICSIATAWQSENKIHITTANLGNVQVFLVILDDEQEPDKATTYSLASNHTIDNPAEKKRIKEIFNTEQDLFIPGMTITRALGDKYNARRGLSYVAEVANHSIDIPKNGKAFLIMANTSMNADSRLTENLLSKIILTNSGLSVENLSLLLINTIHKQKVRTIKSASVALFPINETVTSLAMFGGYEGNSVAHVLSSQIFHELYLQIQDKTLLARSISPTPSPPPPENELSPPSFDSDRREELSPSPKRFFYTPTSPKKSPVPESCMKWLKHRLRQIQFWCGLAGDDQHIQDMDDLLALCDEASFTDVLELIEKRVKHGNFFTLPINDFYNLLNNNLEKYYFERELSLLLGQSLEKISKLYKTHSINLSSRVILFTQQRDGHLTKVKPRIFDRAHCEYLLESYHDKNTNHESQKLYKRANWWLGFRLTELKTKYAKHDTHGSKVEALKTTYCEAQALLFNGVYKPSDVVKSILKDIGHIGINKNTIFQYDDPFTRDLFEIELSIYNQQFEQKVVEFGIKPSSPQPSLLQRIFGITSK